MPGPCFLRRREYRNGNRIKQSAANRRNARAKTQNKEIASVLKKHLGNQAPAARRKAASEAARESERNQWRPNRFEELLEKVKRK